MLNQLMKLCMRIFCDDEYQFVPSHCYLPSQGSCTKDAWIISLFCPVSEPYFFWQASLIPWEHKSLWHTKTLNILHSLNLQQRTDCESLSNKKLHICPFLQHTRKKLASFPCCGSLLQALERWVSFGPRNICAPKRTAFTSTTLKDQAFWPPFLGKDDTYHFILLPWYLHSSLSTRRPCISALCSYNILEKNKCIMLDTDLGIELPTSLIGAVHLE